MPSHGYSVSPLSEAVRAVVSERFSFVCSVGPQWPTAKFEEYGVGHRGPALYDRHERMKNALEPGQLHVHR